MLIISFYTNQNTYKNRKIQVLLRFLVSVSSILAGTDFARVASVHFSFSNLNIGYSTLISSTSNLHLDCITEAYLDFTSFTNFISCEEISQIMNNLLHSICLNGLSIISCVTGLYVKPRSYAPLKRAINTQHITCLVNFAISFAVHLSSMKSFSFIR